MLGVIGDRQNAAYRLLPCDFNPPKFYFEKKVGRDGM